MKYGLMLVDDYSTGEEDDDDDISEILPTLSKYDPYISPEKKALLHELDRTKIQLKTPPMKTDYWKMISGIKKQEEDFEKVEHERKKLMENILSKRLEKVELEEQQLEEECQEQLSREIYDDKEHQEYIRRLSEDYRRRVESVRASVGKKYQEIETKERQQLKQTIEKVVEKEKLKTEEAERALAKERERLEAEERQKRIEKEERENKLREKEEQARRLKEQEDERIRREEAKKVSDQIDGAFGDPDAIKIANDYIKLVTTVKETIDKQVKSNRAMMNEALRYRMRFTTKVGAVTASRSHINQFAKEISDILNHGKSISADMLYVWLLNNLAKQFVKQAETEVSVNMKKAFPIATLTCILYTQHPDLIKYVNGRIMKKCMYAIPRYPQRKTNESNEEYAKSMGYKFQNGIPEQESHFVERMRGIIAYYAAITQTDLSQFALKNPYDLKHAWSFLCRFLNMKPRKISGSLLEVFLKVAGYSFIKKYPQQGPKIIQYIQTEYIPRLGPASGGDKVRLELLMEEYAKNGGFERPEGQLITNN